MKKLTANATDKIKKKNTQSVLVNLSSSEPFLFFLWIINKLAKGKIIEKIQIDKTNQRLLKSWSKMARSMEIAKSKKEKMKSKLVVLKIFFNKFILLNKEEPVN